MIKKTLYTPFKYKGAGKFKYSVYVKNTLNNKAKLIHFGHKDYQDYRQHKDKKRRKSYLARAKGIKNKKGELTWKNKNTKNYWSVHYLWAG
jgi:hypothetical protein